MAVCESRQRVTASDEDRMREIFEFTARTFKTSRPVPFGALIVNTKTGKRLMIATNAVMRRMTRALTAKRAPYAWPARS